jgi:hypothetical protein
MRVIPTYIHGMIDYLAGIVLIALPFLFGFATGAAMWVPILAGIAIIASAGTPRRWLPIVLLASAGRQLRRPCTCRHDRLVRRVERVR